MNRRFVGSGGIPNRGEGRGDIDGRGFVTEVENGEGSLDGWCGEVRGGGRRPRRVGSWTGTGTSDTVFAV